jgi:hypothetical protein
MEAVGYATYIHMDQALFRLLVRGILILDILRGISRRLRMDHRCRDIHPNMN